MNLIFITTKNEIIKIFSRNKTKVILFLEIILCIFMAILGASGNNFSVSGFSISLPNLPFTMLPIFTGAIMPLTIFMLVSDIFSHEFENNSIKAVLLRPVSRFKIFVSKNLAIIIITLLNLAVMLIVTVILRFIFRGELAGTQNAILSYFISIVPMTIFILMSSLIAVIIDNPSLTMFSCIGVYILLIAIKIVFSNISSALFVSYNSWYQMWIGSLVPVKMLINTILLLCSYMAIFFLLGFLIFDRKEV